MDGAEVTQLYVETNGLSMPRPPLKLEGFSPLELKKGERKEVSFYVSPQQFAFYNENMDLVVEPGEYTFKVGASSTDIKLEATVALEGEARTLGQKDIFFSETKVQ